MSEGVTAAAAPAQAKKGFFGRVIGVIIAPGETFEDIRNKPTIVMPLLTLMVLFAAASYVLIPIALPEQAELLPHSPKFQQLPVDQQDIQLGFLEDPPSWAAPVFSVVGTIGLVFVILIYTLVLWGGGHLLGGSPKFRGVLSMMLFASMISPILGTLAKLPLILSKQTVVGVSMSPALFMPGLETTSRMYVGLNTYLDLFSVWGVIVGSIGLSRVAKISLNKGLMIVIAVYLVRSTIIYLQAAANLP